MKSIYKASFSLVLIFIINTQIVQSQLPAESKTKIANAATGLFDTDEIFKITLQGDLKTILKDRDVKSSYHPINIVFATAEQKEVTLAGKVKTRGHFRKQKSKCTYAPLLIRFSKNDLLKTTVFRGQDKLKLVVPCQGDEYVINEWLVYKIYNLITPLSFKVRLVKVTLLDEDKNMHKKPFYAFLLEDEDQMAARNKMVSIERKLQPEQTQQEAFLKMAVFQYLVGNTDWSVKYQQNIKLLSSPNSAVPIAVPYDFDHAGIVEAPYAEPFEALEMSSVRKRRYRGYCIEDLNAFTATIDFYNQIKPAIYNLYNECSLLEARYKRRTIDYLDDFYKIINNEKNWQKEFAYPCDPRGTGNVVIKGLKE